jgi:hypothetical protein
MTQRKKSLSLPSHRGPWPFLGWILALVFWGFLLVQHPAYSFRIWGYLQPSTAQSALDVVFLFLLFNLGIAALHSARTVTVSLVSLVGFGFLSLYEALLGAPEVAFGQCLLIFLSWPALSAGTTTGRKS